MSQCGTVYVVDDDADICTLIDKIVATGFSPAHSVRTFLTAEAFLAEYDDGGTTPRCLVLDICLPGMQGLELQQHLQNQHAILPVIMLTGYADIVLAVRAVKNGALNFLEKPVTRVLLLSQIEEAMAFDERNRSQRAAADDVAQHWASLSVREREVLEMVVDGHNTKEIAAKLGIGIQTVAKHRARALKKLGARSAVEVARQ